MKDIQEKYLNEIRTIFYVNGWDVKYVVPAFPTSAYLIEEDFAVYLQVMTAGELVMYIKTNLSDHRYKLEFVESSNHYELVPLKGLYSGVQYSFLIGGQSPKNWKRAILENRIYSYGLAKINFGLSAYSDHLTLFNSMMKALNATS